MGFKCGIVGLPNVGKSTFFNALTQAANAQAANYPFCTIEPNVGRVCVPDERLDKIATIAQSQNVLATQLEFVDIAGLVQGASQGEGLGNKFLSHIREVDAIIHVLRGFDNDDILHVAGSVDPLRDMEIIETELMIADLQSLQQRLPGIEKKMKGDKTLGKQVDLIKKVIAILDAGQMAITCEYDEKDAPLFKQLQLLTAKPIMYVCNVDEDSAVAGNKYWQAVCEKLTDKVCVMISADIEAQIAQLDSPQDRKEFLDTLGMDASGLDRTIREGYKLLNLITFFTAGPKEARAWTISKEMTAPQAGGVIHSDFEKGFVCAETIAYDDYVACDGTTGAKAAGKMRQEGRDYIVQDGDVFLFRTGLR